MVVVVVVPVVAVASTAKTSPRLSRRSQAGYSLVEVSVAALVVGILIASILSTVTHGFGILARSRETLRAHQILQQEVETVRTYSWSQMTNNVNFGTTNVSDSGVVYWVTRSADSYGNSTNYGSNHLKKVTISIQWTNMTGDSMRKSMTTLVSQNGLNDYLY
jgi:prepilin-type N-terminal cleavage/methylation domain-containing protein